MGYFDSAKATYLLHSICIFNISLISIFIYHQKLEIDQVYVSFLDQISDSTNLRKTVYSDVRILKTSSRQKRQTYTSVELPSLGVEGRAPSISPINNCPVGPAGPPGAAGNNGEPGLDGQPGVKGKDSENVQTMILDMGCQYCPPGEPGMEGVPGKMGPRGPRGQNGPSGSPGHNGFPGSNGPVGNPGPEGLPGQIGVKGKKGMDNIREKGTRGPKGSPGMMGAKGSEGEKGNRGKQGVDGPLGLSGPIGEKGYPGSPGIPGEPGSQGPTGLDALYCNCPKRNGGMGEYQPYKN